MNKKLSLFIEIHIIDSLNRGDPDKQHILIGIYLMLVNAYCFSIEHSDLYIEHMQNNQLKYNDKNAFPFKQHWRGAVGK